MRILLFDIDGTLLQSQGSGKRALARAIDEDLGVQGAAERLHLSGRTDFSVLREVFLSYGIDYEIARAERVLERYLSFLADDIAQQGDCRRWALPGARPLLERLRGLEGLAVATGNVEAGARHKLRAALLDDFFPVGGFGSDHEERPALVRIGAERAKQFYGVQDADVWVIGDTPLDIDAARKNGFLSVGVATGMHPRAELVASGATVVLDSLADSEAEAFFFR
jgi:phosphoglycolate phosphatase-like HAD superfamily hydrolase